MSGVSARLPVPVCCRATTSLTAIETAKLRVVCRELPDVPELLSCEIGAGHDDGHVAFAAAVDDGELWWWLCWGRQTREVRQIDLCDGRWLDDPYLDDCLLPEGHQGLHSFEFEA